MELNEFSEYLNKFNKRNSSFISGTLVIFVDFIALICSILVGFFIVNLFATSNINFRSFINYSFFKYYFRREMISVDLASKIEMPKLHEKPIIRLE